jgi:integrase
MRIYDLKRSQVPRMLDDIADEVGPVQADRVLSYIRKGFNWFEVNGHDDDFRSPAVRGMSRTKPDEHARDRILNDDELRTFWQAANPQRNRPNVFAAILRSILLTVTRRCEASKMHSSELEGDIWTIPGERYKE